MSRYRIPLLLPLFGALSGCSAVVLAPSGDVAAQQRDLLIDSTLLMLVVIIPVMLLTALFAWRYRHSNTAARYEPDWDHSTQLELLIWGAPLLIIIALGALTWMSTHLLDPYRPISRVSEGKPVPARMNAVEVDVVALDWKWLFIYPQYGIATVNELAAPVDRPIEFRITASSVMNSFYIPALAGQIYAMPGMETTLHAVINTPGTYQGFSANFSGDGFSGMRFAFKGLDDAEFAKWVGQARSSGGTLEPALYLQLARPSENQPVSRYGTVDPKLYNRILNECVEDGKMCLSEMMAIDAKGGMGMAGITNTMPLGYDKFARQGAVFGPEPSFPTNLCAVDEASTVSRPLASPIGELSPANLTPVRGLGLKLPSFTPVALPSTVPSGAAYQPSKS